MIAEQQKKVPLGFTHPQGEFPCALQWISLQLVMVKGKICGEFHQVFTVDSAWYLQWIPPDIYGVFCWVFTVDSTRQHGWITDEPFTWLGLAGMVNFTAGFRWMVAGNFTAVFSCHVGVWLSHMSGDHSLNFTHPICLQEVCIIHNFLFHIDSLGTLYNTHLGGMGRYIFSPCTNSSFHTLAGINTFSIFDFSVDIILATLFTESTYHYWCCLFVLKVLLPWTA